MSELRILRRYMTIRFERQEDGTFKRTGELRDGTNLVWIYRDGRRSASPFNRELALRIMEKFTGPTWAFRGVRSYELRPAYTTRVWGYGCLPGAKPDEMKGAVSFVEEFLWQEAEEIGPKLGLDAPLAVFASPENERLLLTSPRYEIQRYEIERKVWGKSRIEWGKPFLLKCDACDARFFIFYHTASTVSPWDRKRLLDTVRVDLQELLAKAHKLGYEHTLDGPFEVTLD